MKTRKTDRLWTQILREILPSREGFMRVENNVVHFNWFETCDVQIFVVDDGQQRVLYWSEPVKVEAEK